MKKAIIYGFYMFISFLVVNCSSSNKEQIIKEKVEEINKGKNPEAYFRIIGTEPFWNIEIAENKIVYQSVEGNKLEFPYNFPEIDKFSGNRVYNTVNGNGSIQIKLYEEFCTDGMSDRDYDYKAEVEIVQFKKASKLKGCGYFTATEFLSGKWQLNQIKSKKFNFDENSIVPFLEFDFENNTVSGNSGCNGINASFLLVKNSIKFDHVLLTRMKCSDLTLENDFVNSLKDISTFKVEGEFLKFYKDEFLEMVFEKK